MVAKSEGAGSSAEVPDAAVEVEGARKKIKSEEEKALQTAIEEAEDEVDRAKSVLKSREEAVLRAKRELREYSRRLNLEEEEKKKTVAALPSGVVLKIAAHSEQYDWVAFAPDPSCHAWDTEMCLEAAAWGDLGMLEWLRGQDPPCPWDAGVCSAAAGGGDLGMLKWLRGQDPPCPWDEWVCYHAASGGQLKILQWLRGQDPPCPWNKESCRSRAEHCGHFRTVEWIDEQL